MTGQWLPPLHWLAGGGLLALNLLFFIGLTLMLGVLINSRGAVVGITLGWLFAGGLSLEVAPWLFRVIPFGLVDIAAVVAKGEPIGTVPSHHLVSGVLWPICFLAVAL